ncbi:hypothetical protein [Microterricola viridarii]|nr:hypothetical protein [Microterricola viridarii]
MEDIPTIGPEMVEAVRTHVGDSDLERSKVAVLEKIDITRIASLEAAAL